MSDSVSREADSILRRIIRKDMTDIQKIFAVYKYMTANISYDFDDASGKRVNILSHTVHGALVNKIAVCEGISMAFSLLTHKANIRSTVVNGTMLSGKSAGIGHSWNMVQIDKDFYHIDVTWDLKNRGIVNFQRYDYFCLNDDDLLKDRKWDRSIYPACTARKYNYFQVMNATASCEEDLINISIKQLNNKGSVYVKILYIDDFDKITDHYKQLIDKSIYAKLERKPKNFSLTPNRSLRTLIVQANY